MPDSEEEVLPDIGWERLRAFAGGSDCGARGSCGVGRGVGRGVGVEKGIV